MMLFFNGRISGISGILHGAIRTPDNDAWRWFFLSGLIIAGFLYNVFFQQQDIIVGEQSFSRLMLGAFLVGFGTRMGSGCTSGHGVCGIARLSKRSITATVLFMLAAILTVFVTRHLL